VLLKTIPVEIKSFIDNIRAEKFIFILNEITTHKGRGRCHLFVK
jgi:hypothetical protein